MTDTVEGAGRLPESAKAARPLAFYLPQFHPIPENDAWWGPGFTEWTNTARARPLFRGHYQPHVPADLGFYDLRVPEAREAQASLAREHRVEGFVYWHYWFAGRLLLERPFREVVASGAPDFPFCVAWANQSWTGAWHGAHERILMEQTYPGEHDDRLHFEHLLPAFEDPRYIGVNGRPLLYIFRPEDLPSPKRFIDTWQAMAQRAGLGGFYFVAEISDLTGRGLSYTTPTADGFDAAVHMRLPMEQVSGVGRLKMRARRKLGHGEVYSYAARPVSRPRTPDGTELLPAVYPNWDNTPRAGRRGLVLERGTPELFAVHVQDAVRRLSSLEASRRLLFIKSWNEWAEGNHMEPDLRDGMTYLEVLARGVVQPPR